MIQSYNQFLESRKDPCWKGFNQRGTKMKNGKEVPNCVRVSEQEVLDEFDRTAFYLDYYTNLTPSDFKLTRSGDSIIIQVPSQ